MNTGIISMRYAKALYDYAVEQGDEEGVYADMKQLLYTLQTIKEIPVLLRDPMLPAKRREELICAVSENSSSFKRFAHLVVKEERVELLLFIAHCFISLYRKRKGILFVSLTTAVPVTEAFKEKVAAIVKGTKEGTIEMDTAVDPSIIGGFVCDVDYRRFDASVSTQLSNARKRLVKLNRKLV